MNRRGFLAALVGLVTTPNLLSRMPVAKPCFAVTRMSKAEWMMLDELAVKAAKDRLRAWADLARVNSPAR